MPDIKPRLAAAAHHELRRDPRYSSWLLVRTSDGFAVLVAIALIAGAFAAAYALS